MIDDLRLTISTRTSHLPTVVGTARCAVPVAERSVRRRNRTGGFNLSSWEFVPPFASLRTGTAQRAAPASPCAAGQLQNPQSRQRKTENMPLTEVPVGPARCAVPVAGRSVRRRHRAQRQATAPSVVRPTLCREDDLRGSFHPTLRRNPARTAQ